jgi:hypothetical protein
MSSSSGFLAMIERLRDLLGGTGGLLSLVGFLVSSAASVVGCCWKRCNDKKKKKKRKRRRTGRGRERRAALS